MKGQISSFDEFWPFYVSQHLHPLNRLLHFIGTGTALAITALAIDLDAYYALPVAVILPYFFAWVGHFVIENNRPATFQHPLWSLRGDFRMCRLIIMKRMSAEIRRLEPELRRLRQEP